MVWAAAMMGIPYVMTKEAIVAIICVPIMVVLMGLTLHWYQSLSARYWFSTGNTNPSGLTTTSVDAFHMGEDDPNGVDLL